MMSGGVNVARGQYARARTDSGFVAMAGRVGQPSLAEGAFCDRMAY